MGQQLIIWIKIFFETELSSIAIEFTQGSEVGLLTKSVPDHFQSWPVLTPPFAIPSWVVSLETALDWLEFGIISALIWLYSSAVFCTNGLSHFSTNSLICKIIIVYH